MEYYSGLKIPLFSMGIAGFSASSEAAKEATRAPSRMVRHVRVNPKAAENERGNELNPRTLKA